MQYITVLLGCCYRAFDRDRNSNVMKQLRLGLWYNYVLSCLPVIATYVKDVLLKGTKRMHSYNTSRCHALHRLSESP